jgi:hypothetical protein
VDVKGVCRPPKALIYTYFGVGWEETIDETLFPFFRDNGLLPAIPGIEPQNMVIISNPFVPDVAGESFEIVSPAVNSARTKMKVPEDGKLNGLIKVQFNRRQERVRQGSNLVNRMPLWSQRSSNHEHSTTNLDQERSSPTNTMERTSKDCISNFVSKLPRSFGRPPNLDRIDNKLFDFCRICVFYH